MKNKFICLLLLCYVLLLAVSCSSTPHSASSTITEVSYPDGIYLGQYWDAQSPQIVIEFELKNNTFVFLNYKTLQYKGANYLFSPNNQSHAYIATQFQELLSYLNGKTIQSLNDLYAPDTIVTNYDAVTSATVKSSKVISTIWDALIRGPYQPTPSTDFSERLSAPDGIYRGFTLNTDNSPLLITFEIQNGVFADFTLLSPANEKEYQPLFDLLLNHTPDTLSLLYEYESVASSSLISAIYYGIHCGIYKETKEAPPSLPSYDDGTYRGYFYGLNNELISIQFTIINNRYEAFTFRSLSFQKNDYLRNDASRNESIITSYYKSFIQSLSGKPLEALYDIDDSILVDAVSGVTINGKGVSASILDGLNHHPYSINISPVFPTRYYYADGSYLATYPMTGSQPLFKLNFTIKNNMFESFKILADNTHGALEDLIQQLEGNAIPTLHRLSSSQDSLLKDQVCYSIWEALDRPLTSSNK